LFQVIGGHFPSGTGKSLGHGLFHDRAVDQFLAQDGRNGVARAIVAGGPEAAGGDDDIGAGPAFAELGGDGVGLIRNGDVALQQCPAPAELGPDEREVSVGGEAEEQFIAQGEQLVANGARCRRGG
jgi:hypothetical protein